MPKTNETILKLWIFIWINLFTFNNSFLLRIIHVKVVTPGCLQSQYSQANKMKGKGGNVEKVPVPKVRGKEESVVWLPGSAGPWRRLLRGKAMTASSSSHKRKLSCSFPKVLSESAKVGGFSPSSPSCPRTLVLQQSSGGLESPGTLARCGKTSASGRWQA